MNRMVGWFVLNGSIVKRDTLDVCQFNTPHWQPDHQAVYVHNKLAMSATQRFITPQCHRGIMPYLDNGTECVINADVYLTNREALCALLGVDTQTADAVLVLQAYLKWGQLCTRYLAGQFSFMIWDPRHQHLFAATDQFSHIPLFYFYQPGQFIMMANECSSFHTLSSPLVLNSRRFVEFAKDVHSPCETAYQNLLKLLPGHQLLITSQELVQTCYWRWKDKKQALPERARDAYYIDLQHYFQRAVHDCLRRIGPLTTQISGGLDSSAVTAQAALLLAKQHESLFAFTSIPNGLAGQSYRSNWYYHELPRINELLEQHSNIEHVIYNAMPCTDIFEKLKPIQLCLDQPLRNINNLDWTLGTYEQVLAQRGRVLLIGAGGNGSISWAGSTKAEAIRMFCVALKAKAFMRRHRRLKNRHEAMLSGQLTAPLRASVYALQLWYGVRRLDPTQALDLSVFCYNVPQWVYRTGNQPLQQRLLTREGLSNLLPKAIKQNPYRGEQGADWYLHYNLHGQRWREQLMTLTPAAQDVLWKSYDRQKIMALFDRYPAIVQPPDRETTNDLCYQLLRCLSAGSYLSQRRF